MRSKGAAALAAIIDEDPRGQYGVADRLNEHQSAVSRWVTEKRSPEVASRKKMQEILGIDWLAWDEPEEEATERADKEAS